MVSGMIVRIVLFDVELTGSIAEDLTNHQVPYKEGKISNGTTMVVIFVLLVFVQSIKNTFDLIEISVLGALQLLRVELGEPSSLTEVWSLAGHLKMEQLLDIVFIRGRGVVKGVVFVVGLLEIFDDCARFPESDAGVRVFDGGDSAVDTDLFKSWLLHVAHVCGTVIIVLGRRRSVTYPSTYRCRGC